MFHKVKKKWVNRRDKRLTPVYIDLSKNSSPSRSCPEEPQQLSGQRKRLWNEVTAKSRKRNATTWKVALTDQQLFPIDATILLEQPYQQQSPTSHQRLYHFFFRKSHSTTMYKHNSQHTLTNELRFVLVNTNDVNWLSAHCTSWAENSWFNLKISPGSNRPSPRNLTVSLLGETAKKKKPSYLFSSFPDEQIR